MHAWIQTEGYLAQGHQLACTASSQSQPYLAGKSVAGWVCHPVRATPGCLFSLGSLGTHASEAADRSHTKDQPGRSYSSTTSACMSKQYILSSVCRGSITLYSLPDIRKRIDLFLLLRLSKPTQSSETSTVASPRIRPKGPRVTRRTPDVAQLHRLRWLLLLLLCLLLIL